MGAPTAEEVWRALEKLPTVEREKKLVEGAKKEGEMVWYTNSGIENATRYIQAFKKRYPFINANFWRSKTRQVTQRIVSEANAGRHLVDVIKPSTDLLPILLDKNLIGRYDTPLRAVYPAHAKPAFYTNMNYAFRVVAHPKVEPIYPRMKELQGLLGTPRIQLNTLEQNAKLLKDGAQILDEVVLKRKSSGH